MGLDEPKPMEAPRNETVEVPIDDNAFDYSLRLISVYIGKNVEKIGLYSFINSPHLSIFNIDNVNIVKEKEVFIKRIENLAKRSCRMSDLTIGQMINFHSYEACCYIFLMLARNKASISEIMFVLSQLKDADFFRRRNTENITFRRKMMYVLLRHPFIYIIFLKLKLIK